MYFYHVATLVSPLLRPASNFLYYIIRQKIIKLNFYNSLIFLKVLTTREKDTFSFFTTHIYLYLHVCVYIYMLVMVVGNLQK